MGLIDYFLKARDRDVLDSARLAERIAVPSQCFDFEALHTHTEAPWEVGGAITPEQPLGNENGPITVAEAAQHLMILGACAAAAMPGDGKRACFIPVHAVWGASYQPRALRCVSTLAVQARARAWNAGRWQKNVEAKTELLSGDEVIGTLSIKYQLFAKRTFRQVFSRQHFTQPNAMELPLRVVFAGHHELVACSPQAYAGRQVNYSMWSVALILYGLNQAIARLLDHELDGQVRYSVQYADIQAVRLVPANEQLFFFANLLSLADEDGVCDFSCSATHNTGVVAILRVVVQIH
ncbi:hypothetical protein D3C85_879440 [compost metagenome]